MSKKFASVAEVQSVREANMPVMFNLQAALEAAKEVKVKQSGNKSELSKNILAVIEASDTPLSCAQIHAALKAGGMTDVTSKDVCNYAWGLAHKQNKIQSLGKGMYGKLEVTTEEATAE